MTAIATAETFRVWVGCLACYNEGRLLGEWFDADTCPDDQESFNAVLKTPASHIAEGHEEFWVMDHENSPVSGEYSPMQAREYAGWMEGLEHHEWAAFMAYISDNDFSETSVQDFRDAYVGQYDGDVDFAQEQAADMGFFDTRLEWPASCIDWPHAARELMYDYWSVRGFYFRNA